MTSFNFINKVKELINEECPGYDIQIVWFCKTIQNFKGLFITLSPDNYYYEATYNGDKDELYLDKYKKVKKVSYKFK